MPLELHWVEPYFSSWEEFNATDRPEPWDCSGRFDCGIGEQGRPETQIFYFVAVTKGALARIQQEPTPRRFLVVEEFTREGIEKSVRDFLDRAGRLNWSDSEKELRKAMYSEYEGKAP
jgi:hypothetical protein